MWEGVHSDVCLVRKLLRQFLKLETLDGRKEEVDGGQTDEDTGHGLNRGWKEAAHVPTEGSEVDNVC